MSWGSKQQKSFYLWVLHTLKCSLPTNNKRHWRCKGITATIFKGCK